MKTGRYGVRTGTTSSNEALDKSVLEPTCVANGWTYEFQKKFRIFERQVTGFGILQDVEYTADHVITTPDFTYVLDSKGYKEQEAVVRSLKQKMLYATHKHRMILIYSQLKHGDESSKLSHIANLQNLIQQIKDKVPPEKIKLAESKSSKSKKIKAKGLKGIKGLRGISGLGFKKL